MIMLEKLPVLGRFLGDGRTGRNGWRHLEASLRKCERRPLYRALIGDVVVCRADLARRALIDSDGCLHREASVWQFGDKQQVSAATAVVLNRWLHGATLKCDVDEAARVAIDQMTTSSGDLHRACLLACVESGAGMFAIDRNPELAAIVRTYIGEVFHAKLVGSQLSEEQKSRTRGLASRAASLLGELDADLPAVLSADGILTGAERGEIYLHAVLSFAGASAVMLAWLVCALHLDRLAGIDMTADARARIFGGEPKHVALEMLRLWPPASRHDRRVLKEHRIGRITALRDDDIVIPVFALHRHRDEWPNAREFDPQRWQDNPRPAAFMPFSAGPGACIGGQFEIKWLAAVVRQAAALCSLKLVQVAECPCVHAMFSPPLCRIAPP